MRGLLQISFLVLVCQLLWSETSIGATWGFGYEPYGLAPYPTPSSGYRLTLKPETGPGYQLSTVTSENEILLLKMKHQSTDAGILLSLSDQLMIAVGLGYQKTTLNYDVQLANLTTESIEDKLEKLSLKTGLTWTWSIFEWIHVGSDLLNVFVPIYQFNKEDQFPDNAHENEENPRDLPFVADAVGVNVQGMRIFIMVVF